MSLHGAAAQTRRGPKLRTWTLRKDGACQPTVTKLRMDDGAEYITVTDADVPKLEARVRELEAALREIAQDYEAHLEGEHLYGLSIEGTKAKQIARAALKEQEG